MEKDPSKDHIKNQLLKVMEGGLDLHLISALAEDCPLSDSESKKVELLKKQHGEGRFYSDIIFYLSHKYFPFETSEKLWREILQHKKELNKSLNRNVGICVSAADYLINRKNIFDYVRLIPEKTMEQVVEIATHDGLTQLYDRFSFDTRLDEEFRRHSRYKKSFSLILIDVDDFKKLNDTHGHQEGDRVLFKLSVIISKTVRSADFPARYGGEEFVVILPETDFDKGKKLAERLRQKVEKEFKNEIPVTISVGGASFPKHSTGKKDLIAKADENLYLAKSEGKNLVKFSN